MTADEQPGGALPWADEVLDRPDLSGWTATELADPPGWEVEGPCPTCKHHVSRTWLLDVMRSGEGASGVSEPGAAEIPVRCKCDYPHAEGRLGCGRSWVVEVEP